jgi:hypothetical protein
MKEIKSSKTIKARYMSPRQSSCLGLPNSPRENEAVACAVRLNSVTETIAAAFSSRKYQNARPINGMPSHRRREEQVAAWSQFEEIFE